MIKNIDNDELNQYIKTSKFALVLFYVDWCGQSIMTLDLFDDLEKEFSKNEIDFFKINSDKNFLWENEKNGKFGIKKSPTFIFFKEGKEINRLEQFQNKKIILDYLRNELNGE
ncbi:MAG: hypothetical protein HPAVJP_1760 [Candidatus Hepatoplasma vulgare]|nr:MAG: hypothetical protein HPAVJP_1760 [Candidatus Hepatoplasma sp.]